MRFAHARPITVTLAAGGVLITAASGFTLAAAEDLGGHGAALSGYSAALTAAAVTDKSCQPLWLTKPPPPTPTPTPTPTHTATRTPTPTPTPTTTTPTPTVHPTTPSPSSSGTSAAARTLTRTARA